MLPTHDTEHTKVVDSYLRGILTYDYESEDNSAPDPVDIVPDDMWPCVLSGLMVLCKVAMEKLAEADDVPFEVELGFWLDDEGPN